jgi:four helix bundle protein
MEDELRDGPDFRDLPSWRLAMDLVRAVYATSGTWREDESFSIAGQVRQEATIIPAKIANGAGRRSAREFAHQVEIARDALGEVETLVNFSVQLGYQEREAITPLLRQIAETRRAIDALLLSLDRAIAQENVNGSGPH